MFGNTPKLTVGRLAGLPVRLDTTFILVPLILFSLLPRQLHEVRLLATAVATAGVFLSVLVHEFGHAMMARREQVGVTEIVIGGFFGYANLRAGAVTRKALIRILAAGPAANLLLFLLLWGMLAVGAPAAADFGQPAFRFGQPPSWSAETLRLLAMVNITMFVFNMVPAYPLDGGKILGLLLDRKLSQRLSLKIVSILGILAGIAMIFAGLGISFMLAFIGFMIVGTNLRRLRRLPRSRAAS